jgi:hypothetical protein
MHSRRFAQILETRSVVAAHERFRAEVRIEQAERVRIVDAARARVVARLADVEIHRRLFAHTGAHDGIHVVANDYLTVVRPARLHRDGPIAHRQADLARERDEQHREGQAVALPLMERRANRAGDLRVLERGQAPLRQAFGEEVELVTRIATFPEGRDERAHLRIEREHLVA